MSDLDLGPTADLAMGGAADLSVADLSPRKGFGESCTDRSECESGFCVFTGLSGICSRICPPDCPQGFGCYGVLGTGIDPGAVIDICVPISTQLCSPCTAHSECSAGGKDLCLTDELGSSFCGRDCSSIACPAGYGCEDLMVAGLPVKQCVPVSRSCECMGPANAGMTVACALTTPLGTCAGTRTCNGAAGFGPCEPPSTADVPDGNFKDDNCDGIDGTYDGGIFVATGGTDDATCGRSHTTPCKTIGRGLVRAVEESVRNVYVQAGDYNEVVVLENGKHIYGGYDANWVRAPRTTAGHTVRIIGGLDGATGQYLAVKAHSLSVTSTVADVVIIGPTPPALHYGKSSYGVHAVNAKLALERVTIQAGHGAPGGHGAHGADAGTLSAPARAGQGGAAEEYSTSCDDSSRGGGGGAGTNSCPDSTNPNGGAGGHGGRMDGGCDCFLGACVCGPCDATAGEEGGAAAVHAVNGHGWPGPGGSGGESCGPPGHGKAGRVVNGAAGSKGSGGVLVASHFWTAGSGTSGGVGENGSGGGGGGGSGGCDQGLDSYGAGGGGGGAGGCRAKSGGGGGGGGGGSFGVFAVSSTVTVTGSEIRRGNGGRGGNGGNGGRGQSGGLGGLGGPTSSETQPGGAGGAGGHGGHGGGGGGGAGGHAIGIYHTGSTVTSTGTTISGGSAGAGGAGGLSAPSAPLAERDGHNGPAGDPGSVAGVLAF